MFDNQVFQVYGKLDMNITQKGKSSVGICKKLKLPHIFNDGFSRGPIIIIFPMIPLLRRNITLKRFFES
jgi:hypothetical protein